VLRLVKNAVPDKTELPDAPTYAPVPPVAANVAEIPNGGYPTGGPGAPVGKPCPLSVPVMVSAGLSRFTRLKVPVNGNGGRAPGIRMVSTISCAFANSEVLPNAM
jgi:hypothetical protein